MRTILCTISLLLVTLSCEEVVDWPLQESELPPLVVDGLITSEKKAHVVRLSKPVTELNKTAEPVSDAVVAIGDGDTVFILTEYPEGSGIYLTDSTVRGVFGKVYTLYINYQGKNFTASANMTPITPMKPLQIAADESREGFFRINYYGSNEPSMMEVLIDWSELAGYDTIPVSQKKARVLFYTLNTIDASEMFKPDKEKVCFPAGAKITRKKYSLSEEHQEFIRTLLSETEWRGGVFDLLPGNVITNVNGGAVGFFAASVVLTDIHIVSFPAPVLSENQTGLAN